MSKEDCVKIPDIPKGFTMPFYYSSLTNIDVFYLVPIERARKFLNDPALEVADFHGFAIVSYNFQLYTGQFSAGVDTPVDKWPTSGASITQELELCIVVHPKWGKPEVSFEQFVLGDEQTKILGNHRVFVPCDSDIAIAAGKTLFGEPKFKTTFKMNLPSLNPVRDDTSPYEPEWVKKHWGFQVNDPSDPNKFIFRCHADLSNLDHVPGNPSPITEYGSFDNKLIACRWNILQPMDTYFLHGDEAERVDLIIGNSSHELKGVMQELIAGAPARAVRTINSSPAAIQSRAFYS